MGQDVERAGEDCKDKVREVGESVQFLQLSKTVTAKFLVCTGSINREALSIIQ